MLLANIVSPVFLFNQFPMRLFSMHQDDGQFYAINVDAQQLNKMTKSIKDEFRFVAFELLWLSISCTINIDNQWSPSVRLFWWAKQTIADLDLENCLRFYLQLQHGSYVNAAHEHNNNHHRHNFYDNFDAAQRSYGNRIGYSLSINIFIALMLFSSKER